MERDEGETLGDRAVGVYLSADAALSAASEGYSQELGLRLLIKTIPFVGATIDTILAEPGMRSRGLRLVQFLEELRDDLSRVADSKVDKDFLATGEFEHVLDVILRRAATTSRDDKRRLLRAALIGAISPDHSSAPLLDSFVDAVEVLSPEHVALLVQISQSGGHFSMDLREVHDDDDAVVAKLQNRQDYRPATQLEKELVFDLTARGFLAYEPTEGAVIGGGRSNTYALTVLGERFLQFLSDGDMNAATASSGHAEPD